MPSNKKKWVLAIGIAAACVGLGAFAFQTRTVHADEMEDKHYMVIFACQGTPNLPRQAHSFATFVKVPDKNGKPDMAKMEAQTISWFTEPENFGLLKPPAVGKNLSLEESLQWAVSRNAALTAFGPYEIKQELYDRAMAQLDHLKSGKVAYKATDRRFRSAGAAVNCFHAISDMVEGPLLDTGTAYGEQASAMVRDHLARWIIDPATTHPFLTEPLGLGKHAITYRK